MYLAAASRAAFATRRAAAPEDMAPIIAADSSMIASKALAACARVAANVQVRGDDD